MKAIRDRKTGRVTLEMSDAEFERLVRVLGTPTPARGLAHANPACTTCGRVGLDHGDHRHAYECPVPMLRELQRKALYECEHVRRRW